MKKEKKETTSASRGILDNIAGITGSFLTVLIAWFYVIGYYYEMGWLVGFDLGSSFSDLTLVNQLLNFFSLMTDVSESFADWFVIIPVFIAAWLIFALLAHYIYGKINKVTRGGRFRELIKKFDAAVANDKDGFAISALISALYFIVPLFLAMLLMFVVLPTKAAFFYGHSKAKEVISNIDECYVVEKSLKTCAMKYGNYATITLKTGVSYSGYVINNNDKYMLLLMKKGVYSINKMNEYVIRVDGSKQYESEGSNTIEITPDS